MSVILREGNRTQNSACTGIGEFCIPIHFARIPRYTRDPDIHEQSHTIHSYISQVPSIKAIEEISGPPSQPDTAGIVQNSFHLVSTLLIQIYNFCSMQSRAVLYTGSCLITIQPSH